MTLDDFEWVEEGFDEYNLTHKVHELTIASVRHFGGWKVWVLLVPPGTAQVGDTIDNFEAAKTIAMIHVNQYMEGYPNVNTYRKRTPEYRPEAVSKGVFRVDKLRS
jgi:hypothetical protein